MTTLLEAQQNITQAKLQLAEEEKKVSEYETQVKGITTPPRNITFQQEIIRGNRTFAGRTEQIIQQRKAAREKGLQQLQEARQQLGLFSSQIAEAESQVSAYQQAEAEIQAEQSAYQQAQNFFNQGVPVTLSGLPPRVRYYYEQLRNSQDAALAYNQKIADIRAGKATIEQSFSPFQISQMTNAGMIVPSKIVTEIPSSTLTETASSSLGEKPISTLTLVPEPKNFLERWSRKLNEYSYKSDNPLVGLGKSVVGTLSVGYGLVTSPKETVTGIGKGIYGVGKRIVTGEGFPEIGEALRNRPSESGGFIAGEIFTLKAPKLFVKTSDFFRTIGLKELEAKSIVAPEYYKGQPFPLITKGETAGELMAEFKPLLPEEVKPAGFTASPKSFAKSTEILAGTSELPGLYQSPKVSPYFLNIIEGEKKLFSITGFENLKPTIARVTPESYGLVPGLKPTAKVGISEKLGKIQTFFETKAKKGKAYIPFIKQEKEAVIPFGTKLEQTGRRFFIKFEGRRMPILEYKTAGEASSILGARQLTAEKVYSLSSRKIGKKSYVSGYDILSSSRYYESVSSRLSLPSYSKKISKLSYAIPNYKIAYSKYPKTKTPDYQRGYSSQYKFKLYTFKGYYLKTQKGLKAKPYKPKGRFKFKQSRKLRALIYRQPIAYQPSIAASILRITSKKTPKEFAGKQEYFFGFRPIVLKR